MLALTEFFINEYARKKSAKISEPRSFISEIYVEELIF